MRSILLIFIFLSLITRAQMGVLKQVPDDVKHFYAGFAITWVTGETVKHFTNNKFLAGLTGIGAAIAAGALKEKVYDQYLGRGVFNFWDGFTTGYGGTTAGMVLTCKWHYQERRLNPELYEFNQYSTPVTDTLKTDSLKYDQRPGE